jgi:hypothetical protein
MSAKTKKKLSLSAKARWAKLHQAPNAPLTAHSTTQPNALLADASDPVSRHLSMIELPPMGVNIVLKNCGVKFHIGTGANT